MATRKCGSLRPPILSSYCYNAFPILPQMPLSIFFLFFFSVPHRIMLWMYAFYTDGDPQFAAPTPPFINSPVYIYIYIFRLLSSIETSYWVPSTTRPFLLLITNVFFLHRWRPAARSAQSSVYKQPCLYIHIYIYIYGLLSSIDIFYWVPSTTRPFLLLITNAFFLYRWRPASVVCSACSCHKCAPPVFSFFFFLRSNTDLGNTSTNYECVLSTQLATRSSQRPLLRGSICESNSPDNRYTSSNDETSPVPSRTPSSVSSHI